MKVQEVIFAGGSEEDHVVAGGGDHRAERPAGVALAGALRRVRLPRTGRPVAGEAVAEATTDGCGGAGAGLYREKYFDLNVRHFHEKLGSKHEVKLTYIWVKGVLQGAGLVAKGRKRGMHSKRRARRPAAGDAAAHRWQPGIAGFRTSVGTT